MFDRYTERARRVIFFARYTVSQYGGKTIESEHLLLAVIREDNNLFHRFLHDHEVAKQIQKDVEAGLVPGEKVSTSVDLPLSDECRRTLAYAAEEAARLKHHYVGVEHLVLGILREENCAASRILNAHGLKLDAMRTTLAAMAPPRDMPEQ